MEGGVTINIYLSIYLSMRANQDTPMRAPGRSHERDSANIAAACIHKAFACAHYAELAQRACLHGWEKDARRHSSNARPICLVPIDTCGRLITDP